MRFRWNATRLLTPLLIALALPACQEATEPEPVRAEMESFGPDNWEAMIGSVVPDSPAVLVTDTAGIPLEGIELEWTVSAGNGQIEPGTVMTPSDGIARAAWTLGEELGEQRVRVSTPVSSDTVVFHAWATPPPPDDWAEVLDIELTATPSEIQSGGERSVTLRLAFINRWAGTLRVKTYDSCLSSPVGYDEDGEWAFSFTGACQFAIWVRSIPPGEVLEWERTRDLDLSPGEYTIRADLHVIAINDDPIELPAPEETLVVR